MDEPQQNSPRARMQQLLAIPERQRTDEQWDELNELEIALASGNRQGGPNPNQNQGHHRGNPQGGQPRQGGGGGGGQPRQGGGGGGGGGQQHRGQRQGRKFHQRPPRQR